MLISQKTPHAPEHEFWVAGNGRGYDFKMAQWLLLTFPE